MVAWGPGVPFRGPGWGRCSRLHDDLFALVLQASHPGDQDLQAGPTAATKSTVAAFKLQGIHKLKDSQRVRCP